MIRYILRIRRNGVTEEAGCGPVSIVNAGSASGVPHLVAVDEAGYVATLWWPFVMFGDTAIRIVGHECKVPPTINNSAEWWLVPVAQEKK